MHVEVTRLLTAWLNDTKTGVNAELENVPRKKVNGSNDPMPKAVKVFNDVDAPKEYAAEDWMVQVEPPEVPALVVIADTDPRTTDTAEKNKPGHVLRGVVIGIGYWSDEVTRDRAVRDGNYTLRAVTRSLQTFIRAPQPERELNGYLVVRFDEMTTQRVAGAVGRSALMGIVFARCTVLNKAP